MRARARRGRRLADVYYRDKCLLWCWLCMSVQYYAGHAVQPLGEAGWGAIVLASRGVAVRLAELER